MGRKAKQESLPGTKSKRDEDLRRKAETYVEIRERMGLTKKEVESKGALLLAMKERKLDTYDDPDIDLVITIEHEERLKVRKKGDDDEEDGAS